MDSPSKGGPIFLNTAPPSEAVDTGSSTVSSGPVSTTHTVVIP